MLLPQISHTTPNGYRLGPEGNEGWKSETSPVCTVHPVRNDISGFSSPQRDNPKRNGSNADGEGMLVVPAPREKPVFDVVVEYQGLKLCRISDAVPYLLGTRNMLDRLQSIIEDNLTHASSIYDATTISPSSPHTYTNRDRALMAILSSLRTLPFARHSRGNWYPQGLATKNDSLILYDHTATHGPEQTHVSLSKFEDMAQTWLYIRNPTNMSGDAPNAKNCWREIAMELRKQNIDISKIDTNLYFELTTTLTGDALSAKIHQIAMWSRTGHLDTRFAAWCEHVDSEKREAKVSVTGGDGGNKEVSARTANLYSKRFTHKHPLGRPRSLVSEDEKGKRRAERFARAAALAITEDDDAKNASKGNGWVRRNWAVKKEKEMKKKKQNTIILVCVVMAIFGPILGVLIWAIATRRLDWTAGGGAGM